MRRYLFLPAFFLIMAMHPLQCEAADVLGFQPVAPYGVFSTFGTSSPGQGQAAFGMLVEKSGEPDFYRISTHLAMGITNSIEAGVSLPYVDNSSEGLEDISVSLRHRFIDDGRYAPSVAYLVAAGLDSGSSEYSTEGYVAGGLVASKRLGPVMGHINLFFIHPGESSLDDSVRYSAAIDFSAAHNFRILGELYGETGFEQDYNDRLEARFGYRFLYGEGVFTTIGVGFGIDDKPPEYRLMAAITFLFPRIEKPVRKVYEE